MQIAPSDEEMKKLKAYVDLPDKSVADLSTPEVFLHVIGQVTNTHTPLPIWHCMTIASKHASLCSSHKLVDLFHTPHSSDRHSGCLVTPFVM